MKAPRTLTVVIANSAPTYVALTCEGEHRPYMRRTVHVALTDEQREALELRDMGNAGNARLYEHVESCFFEPEEDEA